MRQYQYFIFYFNDYVNKLIYPIELDFLGLGSFARLTLRKISIAVNAAG
jgi:hypothetical protein